MGFQFSAVQFERPAEIALFCRSLQERVLALVEEILFADCDELMFLIATQVDFMSGNFKVKRTSDYFRPNGGFVRNSDSWPKKTNVCKRTKQPFIQPAANDCIEP
ncbi:hypothetical protein [Tateyamaria sp.]|uniref:hypothetical protein n=1 Tax=Tateyamaria sp. TaxID=1929288 RepID=UPI0032A0E27F